LFKFLEGDLHSQITQLDRTLSKDNREQWLCSPDDAGVGGLFIFKNFLSTAYRLIKNPA
jgi:hypothetical protein